MANGNFTIKPHRDSSGNFEGILSFYRETVNGYSIHSMDGRGGKKDERAEVRHIDASHLFGHIDLNGGWGKMDLVKYPIWGNENGFSRIFPNWEAANKFVTISSAELDPGIDIETPDEKNEYLNAVAVLASQADDDYNEDDEEFEEIY